MKSELYNNKDFWAGMMLIGTGAASIVIARDYPFGSTLRMGPGYFPTVLGAVLILFGIYIAAMGLRLNKKFKETFSLKALILLPLSLVLFGYLMQKAGFLPALVTLIFGSAAAGRQFKFTEVLLLTAFLSLLSWAVFLWALNLPYPLIKGF